MQKLCPVHLTPLFPVDGCARCRREFRGVLGASGLVEDIYDIPGSDGPRCEALTAIAAEGSSEVNCVRPRSHQGDCESLHGSLWDHDPDTGCCDAPA